MSDKLVEQKLKVAVLHGAKLLVENGLGDWTIKLNNKRSVLAETYHSKKTITFSTPFLIIADKEQLVGVTLHEAAHALVGAGHGHDNVFVKKCKEISPNDEYARYGVTIPLRKYILTCTNCGYSGTNNLKKVRYCGVCFKKDGSIHEFKVTENILKVNVW